MSLENLAGKVCAVGQKLFEVNSGIVVQKHTSNSWSIFVTESGLDIAVNTVSDEFVSCRSLQRRESRDIDWLQVNDLHLLSSWLLLLSLNQWLWYIRHSWLLLSSAVVVI